MTLQKSFTHEKDLGNGDINYSHFIGVSFYLVPEPV